MRIAMIAVALLASTAGAESYSAAGDFSGSNNPTGVWSYGFRASQAATDLTLFSHVEGTDFLAWDRGLAFPNNYPRVVSNQSASAVFWGTDVALQPGEMGYHPGPSGEFCVVRFTAPSAGDWAYSTSSTSLDKLTDGMSIAVVVNGGSVFNTSLSSGTAGQTVSDSRSVSLAAGETIDFVIGSVGNNNGDTCRLDATVRAVPAPASIGLIGVATLAGSRRRRVAV